MNALQWIIKEAKSLKKKFPKRYSTWKEYVAQASAIYASKHKGKSLVGKKKSKIGAAGDYAKFEIATIKSLSKILRKSLKYTQQLVNNDQNILNIISKSFDDKLTPAQTAKIIKQELTPAPKEDKLKAFVDILSKGQKSKGTSSRNFPMKLPATVTIGSHKDTKSHNVRINVTSGISDNKEDVLEKIRYNQKWVDHYTKNINTWLPYKKHKEIAKAIKVNREKIAIHKSHIRQLKKHI